MIYRYHSEDRDIAAPVALIVLFGVGFWVGVLTYAPAVLAWVHVS
jgi:hypothetical protein